MDGFPSSLQAAGENLVNWVDRTKVLLVCIYTYYSLNDGPDYLAEEAYNQTSD